MPWNPSVPRCPYDTQSGPRKRQAAGDEERSAENHVGNLPGRSLAFRCVRSGTFRLSQGLESHRERRARNDITFRAGDEAIVKKVGPTRLARNAVGTPCSGGSDLSPSSSGLKSFGRRGARN
jgi:hypothetical protein